MSRDYREALDNTHPMGAARLVRRDVYAWPGGYEMALVTTDAALLCHTCVEGNFASVSWEHRNETNGGWRPAGYTLIEEPGDAYCDHCSKLFWVEEVVWAEEVDNDQT